MIGTLIALALTTHHAATRSRTRPALSAPAHTGIVIGHLSVCSGLPPMNGQVYYSPGTVAAVRGRLTAKQTGPGTWRLVFPAGPATATSEHITNNYDQTFRFALPPGHYVLEGRYDGAGEAVPGASAQVTVVAGKTIRINVVAACE